MKSACVGSVVAVLGFSLLIPAAPTLVAQQSPRASGSEVVLNEVVLNLDPAKSRVHWTVDSTLHTLHGTFTLKNGSLHFDPETGKAGGEIVVSALSGESGNGSRDARMHREILETAKFPYATFRPTQIDGKVVRPGASDTKLSGVFSIHGQEHNITVQVHTEFSGDAWTGSAKFEVPFVKWGIKDPSNFLLHVKPVVDVALEMSGEAKASK